MEKNKIIIHADGGARGNPGLREYSTRMFHIRSLKPCGFNFSTTGKHPVFPTPFCVPGLL